MANEVQFILNESYSMNKCSLTHNISGIGGVTKKRTKTSCCMNLNYNNAHWRSQGCGGSLLTQRIIYNE